MMNQIRNEYVDNSASSTLFFTALQQKQQMCYFIPDHHPLDLQICRLLFSPMAVVWILNCSQEKIMTELLPNHDRIEINR